MDEKDPCSQNVEGNKKKGSWWMFLFFSCYECVCLFDVGNDVKGVCGVLCVNNV
jgi:hypothetical protein